MRKFTYSVLATVAATAVTGGVSHVAVASTEPPPPEAATADVVLVADHETVVGSATLRRTEEGVLATFQAGGYEPGHTITMWWIVFNEPQNCSDPCGEDDVFVDGEPSKGQNPDSIAAVDAVASWAAGTVANDAGEVYLIARLDQDAPGAGVIFGDGATLKDLAGAEIHLVSRSHGPAVAGMEDIQTTSFGGGCGEGMYPCANQNAAIFKA